MSDIFDEIRQERERQKAVFGYTPTHDLLYNKKGELAHGAIMHCAWQIVDEEDMAIIKSMCDPSVWSWWSADWFRPGDSRRRSLVKACALIVAEIERIDESKDYVPYDQLNNGSPQSTEQTPVDDAKTTSSDEKA